MSNFVDKAEAWDALAKANARIAELKKALSDLRTSALVMHASINASNPEFAHEGLPEWLVDCGLRIDRAARTLNEDSDHMTNEELADFLLGNAIVLSDGYSLSETEEVEGKLVEIARRLRAMSWRPIEEAPKDGTYIDVLDDEGNRWTDVKFCNGRFEDNDGNWIAFSRVSYWMPLPKPPGPADD